LILADANYNQLQDEKQQINLTKKLLWNWTNELIDVSSAHTEMQGGIHKFSIRSSTYTTENIVSSAIEYGLFDSSDARTYEEEIGQ
jgi:hypothetical protein